MRIISTANVPPQQMSWYADSLLGISLDARKKALAKLPAEIISLLEERGLSSALLNGDGVSFENAKLPKELMDMVREYLDADGHGLPMSVDEAREHREKIMRERGAFQRHAEHGWNENTHSFCEH